MRAQASVREPAGPAERQRIPSAVVAFYPGRSGPRPCRGETTDAGRPASRRPNAAAVSNPERSAFTDVSEVFNAQTTGDLYEIACSPDRTFLFSAGHLWMTGALDGTPLQLAGQPSPSR